MAKSKCKEKLEKMREWEEFNKEFAKESDRAAAILGAVMLEEHLQVLLSNFLVDDEEEVEELLGSDKKWDRPLGGFSAKIRAAYCLGLLQSIEFYDLKLIRNVRNRFAHELHGLSFEDQTIKGYCGSLRLPKKILPDVAFSPRGRFMFAVHMLISGLGLRALKAARERRTVPPEKRIIRKRMEGPVEGPEVED